MQDTSKSANINERTPDSIERARRKRDAVVVKDWRKAKPRFEDTQEEREAWALGEEWRKTQTEP